MMNPAASRPATETSGRYSSTLRLSSEPNPRTWVEDSPMLVRHAAMTREARVPPRAAADFQLMPWTSGTTMHKISAPVVTVSMIAEPPCAKAGSRNSTMIPNVRPRPTMARKPRHAAKNTSASASSTAHKAREEPRW